MNEVINFEEAVEVLKTSKPTLYRWMADGRVKGFKVGRAWRFYRDDLQHFLESGDTEQQAHLRSLRQAIAFYSGRLRARGVKEAT
ncbi:MAG TPA: helix-turn-helix domain-containing protein [Candidatus Xenobia bacterium]